MRTDKLLATMLVLGTVGGATAQTVTLTLDSPQHGQVVQPGATVTWQIIFTVSPGDNEGLALLSCDLVQVIGGVGQGTPQLLASGSFAAPTACGAYAFELADAVANVLLERNDPPDFSPVIQPAIDTTSASISFTITLSGDVDLDGDVDLADLAQLLGHYGETSGMTYEDGDLDGDGDVDLSDLAELLGHYGDTCE